MKKVRTDSLIVKGPQFIFNKKPDIKLTKYDVCILTLSFVVAINYRKIYCNILRVRALYYLSTFIEKSVY